MVHRNRGSFRLILALLFGDVVMGAPSAHLAVRGSYSARVPRSSSAEVHREFDHYVMEDEVDGQEEGQDDRREDRQQGEKSGEVEENQTHNMSAWK